jgi:hypothetical protein
MLTQSAAQPEAPWRLPLSSLPSPRFPLRRGWAKAAANSSLLKIS